MCTKKSIIYVLHHNSTQNSGTYKAKWVVEFIEECVDAYNDFMRWNFGGSIASNRLIEFDTLEQATNFASINRITYQVLSCNNNSIGVCSKLYSDNFIPKLYY